MLELWGSRAGLPATDHGPRVRRVSTFFLALYIEIEIKKKYFLKNYP